MNTGSGLFDGAPSSRLRVLKHLNNQKTTLLNSLSVAGKAGFAAELPVENEDPNKPKELQPGSMQLFSYYGEPVHASEYE